MSPGMPTGSIAIAQREPVSDLRLHDVAVFHPPSSPRVIYMHRVIKLEHTHGEILVRTKGDANPVPDPWTLHITSHSIYIVRYRIPAFGYVVLWVHSKTGRETILTLAGLLALALVISSLRDARKGNKISRGTPGEAVDGSPIVDDVIIDLTDHGEGQLSNGPDRSLDETSAPHL
jgi:signal peptidase